MKRVLILKIFALAATFLAAAWLFKDSLTIALAKANPATGRPRACFTDLELLLGITTPTGWIRLAEFIVAGILTVSGLVVVFRSHKSQ
jgi:hypothetical protein